MKPFVSVLVPAREEVYSIDRCLKSILASSYARERMEVIVADGISLDGTRQMILALASEDQRIRLIDNPGRTTPKALNRAIDVARGDVILRVDAHSVIEPDYIEQMVGFLETHPDAWGAGGRMRTVPSKQGLLGEAVGVVLSHRFGVGNSGFRTGTGADPYPVDTVFNCAWRREVFQRVGRFHEQLTRSQDIEFSTRIRRAGGSLWLVPAGRTTYFARTEGWTFLRHNCTNGIWSILPFAYAEGTPVRVRHLVPLVFVAATAGSVAAALWSPLLAWGPAAIVGPYLLINLAASWNAAWKTRSPAMAVLLPLVFAGLHVSYGAGSLWGAIRLAAILCKRKVGAAPVPVPESSL